MHKILTKLISTIPALDSLEESHIANALAWIESGAELFRLEKPATPPKHLVSYFLPIDLETRSILLVDHKKAGLWLPPGGHVDPGEDPLDAAYRELKEELDTTLEPIQTAPFFLTVTETVGHVKKHTDVSLWYLFHANSSTNFNFDPVEFHAIKWFPFDQLPLDRIEPHLPRLIKKLK